MDDLTYQKLKDLTPKEQKALIIANNVLYFDDDSDYETALYEILNVLSDGVIEKAEEYIEEE